MFKEKDEICDQCKPKPIDIEALKTNDVLLVECNCSMYVDIDETFQQELTVEEYKKYLKNPGDPSDWGFNIDIDTFSLNMKILKVVPRTGV